MDAADTVIVENKLRLAQNLKCLGDLSGEDAEATVAGTRVQYSVDLFRVLEIPDSVQDARTIA
jgi:hypothetical protein